MANPPGIVILGTPRSGTTLLRRILDEHPNIACPPETYLLSAAARFLHDDSFAAGLEIGVLSGLGYAGFKEDVVLERLRKFAFGFFEEHARGRGKERWAEKTAFDAFHVEKIRKLCGGHVRFICLQRHGLDVATSLADLVEKTGGYVQELHDYIRRYPEPLAAFTHAWVDTSTAIADLVADDEQAMTVRYEDLASDPETTVKKVLEFVEEPYDESMIARALGGAGQVGFGDWRTYARTSIDKSSVERWKKLPQTSLARLAPIANPTLERLGYDAVSVESEDDEDARRKYELGLLLNRMKGNKE